MNNISKCPICGERPRVQGPDPGYYDLKTYHCCGYAVYADDEKPWNQYAAAMELAKLTVQMKTCRAYCPERAFLHAQDRVLEVFK